MEFIIQHNLINQKQLEKIDSTVKQYPHRYVGVIPFTHEITSDKPLKGKEYFPYGSTRLTEIAYDKGWFGLCFNDNFNMSKSLQYRSRDMLNKGYIFRAGMSKSYLEDWKGNDIFVRPNNDLKHFSGMVIDKNEFIAWMVDATNMPLESGSYAIDPEMLIMVSKPKNIQAEFRWFVVDGNCVSGSMYRHKGQTKHEKCISKELFDEAQKFADGWLPHRTVVMDLALENDEVKIIEFNCANSSGFYDNDVGAVFDAWWRWATD